MQKKIALFSTGGTISRYSDDPFDCVNYGDSTHVLSGSAILSGLPERIHEQFSITSYAFSTEDSANMSFTTWMNLAESIKKILKKQPDIDGIVVTHGTCSLEEAAFFLDLVLHTQCPVVVVGSQRPASALSTDAPANLYAALLVATNAKSANRGVLVVANNEIHSARDVVKTSTYQLETFRSPNFGPLGMLQGNEVVYARQLAHQTSHLVPNICMNGGNIPRVDIAYTYAGSDGTAIKAFIQAGAKGIIAIGMVPGICTKEENDLLDQAVSQGICVVQASSSLYGPVLERKALSRRGILAAGFVPPKKARVLLALALMQGLQKPAIQKLFELV